MAGYDRNFTDELRTRLSIVDVVGRRVPLVKKGQNYWGCCPFHNEKTPSFSVNEEKGFYHCFGCGEHGDIISFTMKSNNMDFVEAIKELANQAGIKMPEYKPKSSEQVAREENYFQIVEAAAKIYQQKLFEPEGKVALDYIRGRGFSDDMIKKYRLGYAPKNNFITNKFANVKQDKLLSIGLCKRGEYGMYDFFRDKLMFPIFNAHGQVVAFSGRSLDGSDPKYINTASTKLFNKGNLLYNFYNAFNEAKKVGYVYLLEGFMDVIACYRVGIKAAIGLMGTALSKDNLQSLRYFGCEIRLCLDLDSPGQLNMQKISDLFDESGIQYKMVNNNVNFSEKDTDEILKNHGDLGLKEYLANLLSKGEWLFNYYQKKLDLNTLDGKKRFILNLLPFLVGIDNDLDQDYYVNKIASLTGYSIEVIFSTIRKYKAKHDKKDVNDEILLKKPNKSEAQIVLSRLQLAEKQILRYMLDNRDMVSQYDLKLGYFSTPIYREIANVIQDYIYTLHDKENYDVKGLMSYLTSELCTSQNKDKILSQISDMVIEEEKIPHCSESQFADLVDTVNKERVKNQTYDVYNASSQNRSELEKAELAKSCLLKVKSIIQEDDKKRRN